MKLRILVVALMVTLMVNVVSGEKYFGTVSIFWTQEEGEGTGNWAAGDEWGDALYWWISPTGGPPYTLAYAIPDGTREIEIYGTASNVTVNTDVAFTSWYSNRARIFGGATLNIEDGAKLDGPGWVSIGYDYGTLGTSTVNQTGGEFILVNGNRLHEGTIYDCEDPAWLDVGGRLSYGIYSISGGTLTYRNHVAEGASIPDGGHIRIGDCKGEGTFIVTGTDPYIQMNYLHIGGRWDLVNDEARSSTGHLVFNVKADGVSAIGIATGVNVHTYASSVSTLTVNLDEALDDPDAEIILVDNQGTDAVVGLFDSFNGGSAAEGAVANIGMGVMRILTYCGGDGNDIVLLVPEPATLALLSLGMFIIRRKK
jgi:hypothetical protein